MDSFTMEPGEERRRGYNFTPDIPVGATLSSYDVKAYDRDGTEVTATVITNGSEQESNNVVTAMFKNAVHGESNLILFSALTDGGETVYGKLVMVGWRA